MNFKLEILNFRRGITLIEIIIVVFIITIFSSILIINFPKVERQLSLSRAAYKFSQDLKRAQDLGGSGFQLKDQNGNLVQAKGYGIYLNNYFLGNKKYIIYIDKDGDQQYIESNDYIIEEIDFEKDEGLNKDGIIIKEIINASSFGLSVNFRAPSFAVKISNLEADKNKVEIVFSISSDLAKTKTVSVNRSGLIEVK